AFVYHARALAGSGRMPTTCRLASTAASKVPPSRKAACASPASASRVRMRRALAMSPTAIRSWPRLRKEVTSSFDNGSAARGSGGGGRGQCRRWRFVRGWRNAARRLRLRKRRRRDRHDIGLRIRKQRPDTGRRRLGRGHLRLGGGRDLGQVRKGLVVGGSLVP